MGAQTMRQSEESAIKAAIFLIFFISSVGSVPLVAAGQTQLPSSGNYSTTFPLVENPLSENGRWTNGRTQGLDWADVQTIGGLAFGSQSGSGGYDDSTALLTGTWGPDQTVQATVRSVNQREDVFEEVELRLRSAISAHSNTGYEINFRCSRGPGRYVQIVRWNGPLGNFTYINSVAGPGLGNGDVVKASMIGNVITVYINGVQILREIDDTYTSGNPGIGFFLKNGTSALNGDFGFTSFAATDGSAPDTQAPTVPANLLATAVSSSRINLAWDQSTDNVGVAGYRVYRDGSEIATTTGTTYADTGLAASTTYTYAVAAFDAAGNLSPQSSPASGMTTAATVDTIPPSVPSNLRSSNVTSESATITWSASTDDVAVTGYAVFRDDSHVGTTTLTTYTDTGLTVSTTYTYTVAAYDAAGNVSARSSPLVVTTAGVAPTPPAFVQTTNDQISTGTKASVAFDTPTQPGNTIVAYVIWNNTGTVTLTDTMGSTFVSAASPVTWGANYRAQVFYATSITGGADTITATFETSVTAFGVIYIHEYAGIDALNPVDVTVSASGTSSTLNSGTAITTSPNTLIFGAGVSDNVVTAAGSGYSARNSAYGNITEDRVGASAGSYSAAATHNGSAWGMQLVAFRPAS